MVELLWLHEPTPGTLMVLVVIAILTISVGTLNIISSEHNYIIQ